MQPLLEVPRQLWNALMAHLRWAGGGVRESGAFLLGHDGSPRQVQAYVPYEDLQQDALNEGYVELRAEAFAELWRRCRYAGLTVVADIHTHRYEAQQSLSDRANPMVAVIGHVACIAPRYAQDDLGPKDLGVFVYQGGHRWDDVTSQPGAIQIRGRAHG